jgi:hypothetical protein
MIEKKSRDRLKLTFFQFVVFMVVFILTISGEVLARETIQAGADKKSGLSKPEDLHFDIAIYGWLSNVSGNVKNGGENKDINVPFSELIKHAQGGFQGYAEIGWKNWFASFDGTWATLGGDYEGSLFSMDLEIKQEIFEIRLGYALFRRMLQQSQQGNKKQGPRLAVLDLYAGERYFGTKTTVKTTNALIEKEHQSMTDVTRWDPFFGMRFAYDLSRHWSVAVKGDIGGFSIGNAAKFTWQVEAILAFRVAQAVTIFACYKALGYDIAEDADSAETDMIQYGPKIGIGLRF